MDKQGKAFETEKSHSGEKLGKIQPQLQLRVEEAVWNAMSSWTRATAL